MINVSILIALALRQASKKHATLLEFRTINCRYPPV